MKIFNKLFFLLSHNERKRAILLLIMIVIMALLDAIGIASILPFIAVLTNPSLIETNIFLNIMYQTSNRFGVETNQEFLFFLGVLVFLILVISLTFKALTTYVQVRFVYMREYSIGKRLVEGYLHQPYSWFLSRNSSDLGKTILSEVSQVISNGIKPLMELIAKSILAIVITTLLFSVDPKLTLIVGLSISFAYLVVFYFVRNLLSRSGKERLKSNQLRFIAVSEAFGAIKEVIIRGLEKFYIRSFSNSSQNYARTIALSQVIAQLPKFILEIISFGGILLIIIYKMTQSKSNSIVKWILIIGLLEFVFWFAVNYLGTKNGALDPFEKLNLINFIDNFNYFHYVVVVLFLLLFYRNFSLITTVDDTKKLMKNILLVRKTVKWYVYCNLINVVIFSVILNILIFNTPDGINILSGIENESFNQEHMRSVFIITQIVVIAVMILILWLFYYLLYGILLKKLNKNYKELTKLNEIS